MTRPSSPRRRFTAALALAATCALPLLAQDAEPAEDAPIPARVVVEPAELELSVGESAKLVARVEAADGTVVEEELVFFSRARRSVGVNGEGEVEALAAGEFEVIVRTRQRLDLPKEDGSGTRKRRLSATVPVRVARLPLERIELELPAVLYAKSSVELGVAPRDTGGFVHDDLDVTLASDSPEVADVDRFGQLSLVAPGRFTLSATCEGVRAEYSGEVLPYPVSELHLTAERVNARTGDVVHAQVVARDASGGSLEAFPIDVSVLAEPIDDLGPQASGQALQSRSDPSDWRFVADTPGRYTLVATTESHVARTTIEVAEREVSGSIKMLGHGRVAESHTSDLWVWEGVDGRDYAVTGTWGADGDAIFWDVTDPTDLVRISSVKVDARTVNDVKVSADGKLCVISREGASNRKNGIVFIDVTNPREPEVLTSYDEGLTGGVHNLFIDGNHVYALSNSRRYDIVNIDDPRKPVTVGTYELKEPGHSIHDVWVVDGLAYSSNWTYGVHVVDVGNGIKGGSPSNPVYVADMTYPSGWNHAAFPYENAEGQTYVVAGDEAFPFGLNIKDKPTYPRGWLHFFDVSDPEHPEEVARYQVPEAGTHNLWIEDDIAYVAYYNGGLRIVDVSGEVMGDLYRQGREMATFRTDDPEGHISNAPMVWGPQPHKGVIFFSDWNSGLWSARFEQGSGE